MREYKTYVFDLDGTLLNTINDLAASVNFALKEYGMPQHTVDEVRNFVGNGVKKLMERAVPDGLDNQLFEDAYATFKNITWSMDSTQQSHIRVSWIFFAN